MRKLLLLILSVSLLLSIFPLTALAEQEVSLFINDEEIEMVTLPVFRNQRTMVPLNSGFFKKLGALAHYNEETGTVSIDGNYSTVEFTIGEKKALVHRKYDFTGIPETIEIDVEPFILDGEVYIPLRFAAEGLGALVEWDGVNKSVLVTLETATDIIPVERPAEYEEIDISELSEDDELYSWVQENRYNTGIYHKVLDNKTYVLICAGEKPTGGYSVEIDSATVVYPGKVYLVAKITEPSPDDMVIQVITYPCRLIVIEGEFEVDGIIENSADTDAEEIQFEVIDPAAIEADEELSEWVNGLHKQAGIHYRNKDGYAYALVAAGQKNTGGYSVVTDKVVRKQSGDVFIYATVHSPDPDMMVIQVITWPYTVIRFEGTGMEKISGTIQDSSPAEDISDGLSVK